MVQKMLDDLKLGIKDVVGQRSVIQKLDPARYTSETFGLPTIQDILKELENPAAIRAPSSKRPASSKAWTGWRTCVPA